MAVLIGTMRFTFFDGVPAADIPLAVASLKVMCPLTVYVDSVFLCSGIVMSLLMRSDVAHRCQVPN